MNNTPEVDGPQELKETYVFIGAMPKQWRALCKNVIAARVSEGWAVRSVLAAPASCGDRVNIDITYQKREQPR